MEKVYRLLPWLTTSEATHFLFQLTGAQVTADHLGQFCTGDHCNAYIACGSVKGEQYETTLSVCAGDDAQKLLRPEHMTRELIEGCDGRPEEVLFARRPLVAGAGWLYQKDHSSPKFEKYLEWNITTGTEWHQVIFKPADIQALADKMNGAAGQPIAADFETQRQQLEKAQADLEAAKVSYEILRKQNHDVRQMWENTQAKNTQLSKELADSKCIEGECRHHQGQPPEHQSEAPTTGLTFPYATKHLEAMRDAAIAHWSEHDRAKPAPYGIQKQVQSFIAELTGENARKVAELTKAIKPDDLPKS